MIRFVIFDVGGVIVKYDLMKNHYPLLAKKAHLSKEEVKKRIERRLLPMFDRGEISGKEFEKQVAKILGIREKDVCWRTNFEKFAKINPKTIATIRALAKRHYCVVFFSNVDRIRARHMLRLLRPYTKLFYKHFLSSSIHMRKPEKRAYLYVLKALNAKPSEAVFIDNTPANVKGAEAVGIKSILFKSNYKLNKELKRMGIL